MWSWTFIPGRLRYCPQVARRRVLL